MQQMQPHMWKAGEKFKRALKQSKSDSLADGFASLNLGSTSVGTWIEAVDSASGRKYYYNSFTKQTRWDNPEKKVGGAAAAAAAAAMSHHTGA